LNSIRTLGTEQSLFPSSQIEIDKIIQQLMVFGKLAASERDLFQKSLQLSIVINAVEIVEQNVTSSPYLEP
jgi:hypothetical protein